MLDLGIESATLDMMLFADSLVNVDAPIGAYVIVAAKKLEFKTTPGKYFYALRAKHVDSETTFKFSSFDVSSFVIGTKKQGELIAVQPGKKAQFTEHFSIKGCVARTGEKKYPFYCYTGYETYKTARLVVGANKAALIAQLEQSTVSPEHVDKFYRTIELDAQIIEFV